MIARWGAGFGLASRVVASCRHSAPDSCSFYNPVHASPTYLSKLITSSSLQKNMISKFRHSKARKQTQIPQARRINKVSSVPAVSLGYRIGVKESRPDESRRMVEPMAESDSAIGSSCRLKSGLVLITGSLLFRDGKVAGAHALAVRAAAVGHHTYAARFCRFVRYSPVKGR